MNAERLLAQYERTADAPDAIPRLRRFVLDLAVRGKLVPQKLSDEPASELLKRIMAEKVRLRIKTAVSALEPEEIPFELPVGWSWSRIGEVCSKTGSGSTPRGGKEVYKEAGIPFLRSQNVYDDGLRLGDVAYIDPETHERMDGTRVLPRDLLLNITGGSIGRCCRVPDDFGEANVSQHVAILRTPVKGIEEFLHLLVVSSYFQGFIFDEQTGAGRGGLPKNRMDQIPVALPPLAEQHRIIAKVDELMDLCDQLEAARAEREATRDRLTAVSLARLNAPDPDTFQDDARFALDSLPPLTARADQIKQLRQTIFNLAVRGKLVPQDPNDEPASELLKRVAAKKAERKKTSGDARIKMEPDPRPEDLPMALPHGWAVQSFENLFLFIDYRGKTPPKTNEGMPLITAKNIRTGYLNREPREYVSKSTFRTWMTRGFPEIGDLFFTTEAPLANICLNNIEEPFALAQRIICFQPYAKINTKFLMFAIMSDVMQSLIDAHPTGLTAKGIKAAKLKPLPIPVPSLSEQNRIVAKVDELMALCDRLEASLATADESRRRLLEALLAEALTPDAERELEAAE
jgi:type I restriction enzyme, S subunit